MKSKIYTLLLLSLLSLLSSISLLAQTTDEIKQHRSLPYIDTTTLTTSKGKLVFITKCDSNSMLSTTDFRNFISDFELNEEAEQKQIYKDIALVQLELDDDKKIVNYFVKTPAKLVAFNKYCEQLCEDLIGQSLASTFCYPEMKLSDFERFSVLPIAYKRSE